MASQSDFLSPSTVAGDVGVLRGVPLHLPLGLPSRLFLQDGRHVVHCSPHHRQVRTALIYTLFIQDASSKWRMETTLPSVGVFTQLANNIQWSARKSANVSCAKGLKAQNTSPRLLSPWHRRLGVYVPFFNDLVFRSNFRPFHNRQKRLNV